nr:hypothetical protein [uncultured Romboutsia sp.]
MLNNREIKNIIGTIHILDSYIEDLLDAHSLDVAKGNGNDGADFVNDKIRMFNELLDTAELLGIEVEDVYIKFDLVDEYSEEDGLISKILSAVDEYRRDNIEVNNSLEEDIVKNRNPFQEGFIYDNPFL